MDAQTALKKYGGKKLPAKYADLFSLSDGSHSSRDDGMCAMELAAWIAGRPHNDHPPCVSPVITNFAIAWNDSLTTNKLRDTLIRPTLPKLLGTANDGQDKDRGWMALDWLIREYTPAFLALVPELKGQAAAMRALKPVGGNAALKAAQIVLSDARIKAEAAWSAAWSAADSAASSAAESAAWSAAWLAARDSAREFLAPAVEKLQASAAELLVRMAELGRQ